MALTTFYAYKEPVFTTPRIRAGKQRALPDFAELRAMDSYQLDDDFDGDTLNAKYQSTASGANSVAAAINTGVVNGGIRLDPGDANGGRCDLSLGLHLRGDQGPLVFWRFTTPSAITNWKFELGVTDVISGTDAGAVNVKATPSFNADDAVVLCRDTSHNAAVALLAVKATVAATPAVFNTVLALSTYYYAGIELRNDNARGWLLDANGAILEQTAWVTSAVTATTLLTPWAFTQNRSGAQHVLDIDSVWARQRRTSQ